MFLWFGREGGRRRRSAVLSRFKASLSNTIQVGSGGGVGIGEPVVGGIMESFPVLGVGFESLANDGGEIDVVGEGDVADLLVEIVVESYMEKVGFHGASFRDRGA